MNYTESDIPPSRFSAHTNYNNLNSLKSAFSPRSRGTTSGFHKHDLKKNIKFL